MHQPWMGNDFTNDESQEISRVEFASYDASYSLLLLYRNYKCYEYGSDLEFITCHSPKTDLINASDEFPMFFLLASIDLRRRK